MWPGPHGMVADRQAGLKSTLELCPLVLLGLTKGSGAEALPASTGTAGEERLEDLRSCLKWKAVR